MQRNRPSRRRRPEPRRYDVLPLDKALEIMELLAAQPSGLTVTEIIAQLRSPAAQVIRTIAFLQSRRWLRADPHDQRFTVGDRVIDLSDERS